ncbi:MAG: hydroxymethylpyrimidine/phosphomethylpyrimidine kinase [Methyloglobulus sp.]|nr:hydroxymethylpyrimidine/phosphomethylpyrimidine kinase [Methyloglobulus sp.]
MRSNLPAVLTFSGHDPSGGAGIQADIQAIASHGCHATSVITALTEQDTHNVKKLIPQRPDDIISQANTLLADIPIKAIKIGLLGHSDTVQAIHTVLKLHPHIPVVLDPVLAAGGGADLSDKQLIAQIIDLLLPCTTILTPNSQEARRLSGLDELNPCGLWLLEQGCDYVLITGAHEATTDVSNQLFHDGRNSETYRWNRLPYSYHGSGCTLAASIAALLAQNLDPLQAIAEAQEYTWDSLAAGYQPGKGQHIPNRLFWVDDE